MSKPASTDKPLLLCNVDYPLYSVKILSERHILVAGGGGSSSTGVKNCCEIYELIYDGSVDAPRAVPVARLNTDKSAVMNMCVIAHSNFHFELLTGGDQGMCTSYDVKLSIQSPESESQGQHHNQRRPSDRPRTGSFASQSSDSGNLRKRLNSISKQASLEGGDLPHENGALPQNGFNHHAQQQQQQQQNLHQSHGHDIPEYRFEFNQVQSFRTDMHPTDAHQKLVKYSRQSKLLFTAGSDLTVRIWRRDNDAGWTRVREFVAHEKEMDDLDVHPMGTHLTSVGRDGRIMVWNVNTGKVITALTHEPMLPKTKTPNGAESPVKYIARACRYGTVEGDITKVRLFLILNPLSLSSPSTGSFISKWIVQDDKYSFAKIESTGKFHLSSMAISDNGQFLSVGDNRGDVQVFIAFSLQRCYHVSNAHASIFITGLEFVPTTTPSLELVGGNSEGSLISISVDNRVVMHRIAQRPTLGPVGSFLFFFVFMLAIYVGMTLMDL